ncbi:L,D-transpeptidase [Corynebacterium sp. 320]|uniref:L,D-transpeptidase n=1 Tax=Corynebacterium TaxID=1716 RepID=UPI00125CCA45|nr:MULTISPECIES: L,D-transpeptidase [Corynebacterium]KAB1503018.1 L,D-transpeptidase [Corynebacterium sp. 320]KAB3526815.1 L,D-transpeptidase [Corynebacterium sp. 250]QNP92572.1 L,D-transpeptidase [Corynebacterium zhongnanshanii]
MISHRKNSVRGKVAAVALSALTVAGMSTGIASAQPAAPGSAPAPTQGDFNNWVLDQRDTLSAQADALPEQFRGPVRDAIDNTTNFVAPGALQARADETARRDAAARAEQARIAAEQDAARRATNTANTPCPAWARACVDIAGHRSWLQDGGRTVYGPVRSNTGRPGQETPRGTFTIQYKVKDEVSREFNNAPMPWATYFTNSGHAFHQGDPTVQSAGCVRLDADSARTFFNHLNPGDKVFIY